MPVDAKRNMMNASRNFEIIHPKLNAVLDGKKTKLHTSGFDGKIGGYSVIIDGTKSEPEVCFAESKFSLDEMQKEPHESIYFDGIENVTNRW